MEKYKNVNTFYASDINSWKDWLSVNSQITSAVFLILYKKGSGTPSITYDEAVDVALCFGWIDSKINKRDESSWYQYFAKRNPKSNWSKVNKAKVEKLLAEGRMALPGLEMIRIAKETGTWTALDDVENLVLPIEMNRMLEKNKVALDYWDAFPRSVKRGILEWIFNAKKPETKSERIAKTIAMASVNKRANFEK